MSSQPSRREALAGMTAAAAAALVSRRVQAAQRPNLVFVLIDDLRWNLLGCMGHPWVPTPNIDRLAAEGVAFDNAFVAISLCSPSRATMLTGCHPQRTGVFLNSKNDVDTRVPTFGPLLQGAGYSTAFIGKWHLPPYNRVRPGWDHWRIFRGQGDYVDPELWGADGFYNAQGYMTDLLTDQAVEWLGERTGPEPFALVLSHKGVHGTPVPAARHAEAFPTEEFPEPSSWRDELADKPAYQRGRILWGPHAAAWEKRLAAGQTIPPAITPRAWRPRHPIHLDTARCLLSVDESVGRVLDALEAMGKLDDTLVVFTSDNGVMLGEHGLLPGGKQMLYEESIRIPLLMRGPGVGKPGSRCPAMVSALDLAPTLCDIGGVDARPPMHGRSLRPLLAKPRRQPKDWREDLLLQHFADPRWAPARPSIHGLRTERWKVVLTPDHEDGVELYDLKQDPVEMVNLAGDPAHAERLGGLRARLTERLAGVEADRP